MDTHFETVPPFVRIGVVSRLTGLSISRLRRLADGGVIPCYRVRQSDHRLFRRDESVHLVRELLYRDR